MKRRDFIKNILAAPLLVLVPTLAIPKADSRKITRFKFSKDGDWLDWDYDWTPDICEKKPNGFYPQTVMANVGEVYRGEFSLEDPQEPRQFVFALEWNDGRIWNVKNGWGDQWPPFS